MILKATVGFELLSLAIELIISASIKEMKWGSLETKLK